MATSAACAFKDFIVVAAAVFFVVVKPVNALLAPQTKDTPATTRNCPDCMHSVPLQATRCPSCTCDLEPALVRVEPARAEAAALERERARRVFFQAPVCTGAMRSSVAPPVRGGASDVLAAHLQTYVGLTIQVPL